MIEGHTAQYNGFRLRCRACCVAERAALPNMLNATPCLPAAVRWHIVSSGRECLSGALRSLRGHLKGGDRSIADGQAAVDNVVRGAHVEQSALIVLRSRRQNSATALRHDIAV
jgi:hypothetical protein